MLAKLTAELIESLLREEESTSLDFKRDQYRFVAASDVDKSELLKDILAFANSWRRSTAFILIGVEETSPGQRSIVGITAHLQDSDLQQFVNSKTQRPVTFSYEPYLLSGVEIGVIQIGPQKRPIFLRNDYGKLKRNTVYIRRGSSTAIVEDPDEFAQMGKESDPTVADSSQPYANLAAQIQLRKSSHIKNDRFECHAHFAVTSTNHVSSQAGKMYLSISHPIEPTIGSNMLWRIEKNTEIAIAENQPVPALRLLGEWNAPKSGPVFHGDWHNFYNNGFSFEKKSSTSILELHLIEFRLVTSGGPPRYEYYVAGFTPAPLEKVQIIKLDLEDLKQFYFDEGVFQNIRSYEIFGSSRLKHNSCGVTEAAIETYLANYGSNVVYFISSNVSLNFPTISIELKSGECPRGIRIDPGHAAKFICMLHPNENESHAIHKAALTMSDGNISVALQYQDFADNKKKTLVVS